MNIHHAGEANDQATEKNKLSKEAIIDAAIDVFSKKGYRGTTIKDLTSIFGVSKPAIYYYFNNKMEILLELYKRGFQETAKDLENLLAKDIPTDEKFRKALELHTRNAIKDVKLQRIWYFDKMELPKKVSKEISIRRREYTDRIIAIYEQGVREGIFKSVETKTAVYILLGACNWLIMWYSRRTSPDPDTIVRTLMTILAEGYEIQPEP